MYRKKKLCKQSVDRISTLTWIEFATQPEFKSQLGKDIANMYRDGGRHFRLERNIQWLIQKFLTYMLLQQWHGADLNGHVPNPAVAKAP